MPKTRPEVVADDWGGDDQETMFLILRLLEKQEEEARQRIWKAVGVFNGWLRNA